MKTRPVERFDLLDLLSTLEEHCEFRAGALVCVQRSGRPWRINRVKAISDNTLTLDIGHEYAVETGLPSANANELQGFSRQRHQVKPLKREHVEYLLILELQKTAEKINVGCLTEAQRQRLIPAAVTVATLLRELKAMAPSPGNVQDRQRALETSEKS